jgi:hypothetical protein
MPENHSRADKRVELINVNSKPHDKYRNHDPWTGKEIKPGIPMLSSRGSGLVLDKQVTFTDIYCSQCGVKVHYDSDSEPVCENCGLICSAGDDARTEQIVIDAKAAGRIDGEQ